MLTAWSVADKFNSFADALVYAWRVIKLQIALLCGVVEFQYRKVDGSVRKAVGTLDISYERKSSQTSKRGAFTYWDIEAGGFRSCRIESLIF